jgi:YHS domain-containing protein
MKRMSWISKVLLGIALCSSNFVNADEGQDRSGRSGNGSEAKTVTGPHGGEVSRAGNQWCEVVFEPRNIRVYIYDGKGQPVSAKGVRGSVIMKVDGNPKQYRFDLYPEGTNDSEPNSLYLAVDLSKIPEGKMSSTFSLDGLPGNGRRSPTFAQVFRLTNNAEKQAIAAQQICPVSGKKLGSMGGAIKVSVKGRDVYVCCKGCVNTLLRSPDKYLARLPRTNAGPTKATKADARAVAFQKICPVMDEPLNAMGGPWKVNIEGREVFVCCKGCIKFWKKDPDKYFSKIPTPAPAKATKADAAAIARQKLCPVMGEPLNAMGGPWKVYANGRPIFLCCKGCIKKVQKNPDFFIAKTAKLKSQSLVR